MRQKNVWVGFFCLAMLMTALQASAGVIARNGTGMDETLECQGQEVKVNGASNHFEIMGACSKLSVRGTMNVIEVEQVGSIRVEGASNKITWVQALKGRKPKVVSIGAGNKIVQGVMEPREEEAPPAEAAPEPREDGERGEHHGHRGARHERKPDIDISGVDLNREIECEGENVSVSGNSNHVRLSGECGTLSVSGNDIEVWVETVAAISVSGNDNKITWVRSAEGKKPRIDESGNDNIVQKEKQP